MSANSPVAFDPQNLAGALRERIRDTLGQLIPDAEWEKLMRAEIARFFRSSGDGTYQFRESDFHTIVVDVLREDVRKRFAAYIETAPEWREQFEPGGAAHPPEVIVQALAKATPDLVRAVLTGFCKGLEGGVVFSVQQALQERR